METATARAPAPGRTPTRVALVLLTGPAALALALALVAFASPRTAVFGLVPLGVAATTAGLGARAWRDPGRRGPAVGLLGLALVEAITATWWIRSRRPFDGELALTAALLAVLLAATCLLAVARLQQLGVGADLRPGPRRAAMAAGALAVVVLGTLAPVLDQPPFRPLELAARATVDRDCGRIRVPDPRGMGSVGYESIDPAPDDWAALPVGRRVRGTLVLATDRSATFVANGVALRLAPSDGLSPCP